MSDTMLADIDELDMDLTHADYDYILWRLIPSAQRKP